MSYFDEKRNTIVLDGTCLVEDCKNPLPVSDKLELTCEEHMKLMREAAKRWMGSRETYEKLKPEPSP